MADTAIAMEQGTDALAGLEERIQKAVVLVGNLRKENDALTNERDEAVAEVERLSSEVAAMREERTLVRSRIEKLLGHIDQLSL
jgi:FtsZ-binding cell division protein ZapB